MGKEGRAEAMNGNGSLFRRYRAVYVAASTIRKVTFEACSLDEAQRLATVWGFGLEGEVVGEGDDTQGQAVGPEAFDVTKACRILGDISRTTLYRLLLRGKLERLPATRKVLVTRRSIERFCSRVP